MIGTFLSKLLSKIDDKAALMLSLMVAFSVGAVFVLMIVITAPPKQELVCPPFMDKAIYEINGVYVWYKLDQGPKEYTELGYEFIEACGYEVIYNPVRIEPPEPPPPEEGGA